jgi:periplasmic divalent cation tolerance protein
MAEFIQVMTAIGSRDDALKIAESTVGKRLAACAQVIGPITSTYWWQGAMETTEEWLCLVKTRKELYKELEQAIREAHTYDEPEILAIPVVDGSQSYLAWIEREVKDGGRP